MTIEDAKPGDIYADDGGKLWRILEVINEPTVVAEEVEGHLHDPNAPPPIPMAAQGACFTGPSYRAPSILKAVKREFTNSRVWAGWRRIWRPSAAA